MPQWPCKWAVPAVAVPCAPLLLALIVLPGCAQELPGLTPLYEQEFVPNYTQRDEVLPLRPHWDARGTLRWGGPQRSLGAAECSADMTPDAKVWQEFPRIEEVRCYRADGILHAAWLLSFGLNESMRWRVSLLADRVDADSVAGISETGVGLVSGRWVSNDGLIHGNLIAGTQIPLLAPIAWSNDTLAKVTIGNDARSLERVTLTSGSRAALPPLPRAGWLSHWQVRDLAISQDGRWLAAGLQSSWRGPAPVAVAVFDLAQNRWVALETLCKKRVCQSPTVLASNAKIGLAYRDVSAARTKLITYALPK